MRTGVQVLARQREQARARRVLQSELPAFGRLDRDPPGGRREVRDGAQRGQMLDRLVGRAVLAEADDIVRHHVDDADRPSAPRGGSEGRQ